MFPSKAATLSGKHIVDTGYSSGYSTVFAGSNQYVKCGDVTQLNSVTKFSISSWSKHTTAADQRYWGKYIDNDDAMNLRTVAGEIRMTIAKDGTATYLRDDSNNHVDDVWEHYVVVYDGTKATANNRLKVYKDGAILRNTTYIGTIPESLPDFATKEFYIGRENGGYFVGNIDDVGLWDIALSSDAANTLYNNGTPTDLTVDSAYYENSADLKGWWKMGDGDSHPTIIDHSGSGYNGTMVNMASSDFVEDTPS